MGDSFSDGDDFPLPRNTKHYKNCKQIRDRLPVQNRRGRPRKCRNKRRKELLSKCTEEPQAEITKPPTNIPQQISTTNLPSETSKRDEDMEVKQHAPPTFTIQDFPPLPPPAGQTAEQSSQPAALKSPISVTPLSQLPASGDEQKLLEHKLALPEGTKIYKLQSSNAVKINQPEVQTSTATSKFTNKNQPLAPIVFCTRNLFGGKTPKNDSSRLQTNPRGPSAVASRDSKKLPSAKQKQTRSSPNKTLGERRGIKGVLLKQLHAIQQEAEQCQKEEEHSQSLHQRPEKKINENIYITVKQDYKFEIVKHPGKLQNARSYYLNIHDVSKLDLIQKLMAQSMAFLKMIEILQSNSSQIQQMERVPVMFSPLCSAVPPSDATENQKECFNKMLKFHKLKIIPFENPTEDIQIQNIWADIKRLSRHQEDTKSSKRKIVESTPPSVPDKKRNIAAKSFLEKPLPAPSSSQNDRHLTEFNQHGVLAPTVATIQSLFPVENVSVSLKAADTTNNITTASASVKFSSSDGTSGGDMFNELIPCVQQPTQVLHQGQGNQVQQQISLNSSLNPFAPPFEPREASTQTIHPPRDWDLGMNDSHIPPASEHFEFNVDEFLNDEDIIKNIDDFLHLPPL